MVYKFFIENRLPSLNDYIDQCRFNKYNAARFKKTIDNMIIYEIYRQLKNVKIIKPVIVHLHFIEENKKRDIDNIYSAAKYVLDALVKTKVLENDNPKHVVDIKYSYEYAKQNKVIVTLEEIE
jgi:Holliday junction resolvase RusA-like endonuclease